MADISMINIIEQNKEASAILAVFIFLALIAWNAYLQYGLSSLKKRSRVFFAGKDAKDLEGILHQHLARTNEVAAKMESIAQINTKIKNDLSLCIQKVGIVRFNPFGEVGGNQSFAIAILDNFASGVIILSLYSREGVRIYAKPIKEGKSAYQLSKEEEEAIKKAIES